MLGIVGAYAAGSSRHLRTSIYVLVLAIGLFAFLTMQVFILYWRKRNGSSRDIEISQPSIQGDGGEDNANKSGVQRSSAADGEIILSCTGGNQRYPGTGGNATDPMETRKTGDKSCGQGASSNMQNGTSGSMNKGLREYLMLLGVLAASVTYQSGLKPPGGMWQEDKSGHVAGDSILHDINKRRYLTFFYSNSTSFMASIVVIVLLLPSTLHSYHLPLWPMHTAILLDMLGLLAAYAAGSNRDMETTMKVIGLVIPVVAYIAIYPVFSFFRNKRNSKNSGGIINLPQHGNLSYEPGNAMN
uniref:PGG domain-containing protein n=1 Tax=Arundo donax TaxID=35708 RepID=A0A0A9AQY6_ARUDO